MFNWPRIWRFLFRHPSETAAKFCNADGVPCTNVNMEFTFSIAWVLSKYLFSFTQMEMHFLGRYLCTCLNQKMRCGYAVGRCVRSASHSSEIHGRRWMVETSFLALVHRFFFCRKVRGILVGNVFVKGAWLNVCSMPNLISYSWMSIQQMFWVVWTELVTNSDKLTSGSGQDTFLFFYSFYFLAQKPPVGQELLINEVSRSHTTMLHIR
jgi:hypothetical protein